MKIKIKELLKKIWIWLLKWGWQIINFAILIGIYILNKGNVGVEFLCGIWIFIIIGLNCYKWIVKDWCHCKPEDSN